MNTNMLATQPAREAPQRVADACFHGGAFFKTIGEEFTHLDRRRQVINADVLDAWFPPAPSVIAALRDHLPWLLQTSPPTQCQGLVRVISRARDVPASCVLPGAGSSDLMFLALRAWLTPRSRVLMLDPTYGEYAYVCERVIGCTVDRMTLDRRDRYSVDLDVLEAMLQTEYDLVILVNPNNPTGQHIPRVALEAVLRRMPSTSRCWVDEAYVDYCGLDESLERFAVSRSNVVVCKSMSKVYALSGMRAAYLIANADIVRELRGLTPPWAVSLPAQVAAVHALRASDYYAACYFKTHELREYLAQGLRTICPSSEVVGGAGNWLLWYPPSAGPSPAEIARRCRTHGLFIREFDGPHRETGGDVLRLAVKDLDTQKRMLGILEWALGGK